MAVDGISDGPALAAANVSLAIGTGTDAAIGAAGITLVSGSLAGVVTAISLSRAAICNIRQNLFFALPCNAIGIPVADERAAQSGGHRCPGHGLSADRSWSR